MKVESGLFQEALLKTILLFLGSIIITLKHMRIILMIVILGFVSGTVFAGDLQGGFMLGANYSNFQWVPAGSNTSDKFSTTGYSASGGILLSFFQNNHVGFRIAGLENLVSSAGTGSGSLSGQTASISGTAPAGAATLDFNFDAGPNRHSIGIGYAYASFSGLTCSGTTSFPTSTSGAGLAVDIKEVWKSGLFGYALGILPVDNLNAFSLITTVFVGVGYDFGASK